MLRVCVQFDPTEKIWPGRLWLWVNVCKVWLRVWGTPSDDVDLAEISSKRPSVPHACTYPCRYRRLISGCHRFSLCPSTFRSQARKWAPSYFWWQLHANCFVMIDIYKQLYIIYILLFSDLIRKTQRWSKVWEQIEFHFILFSLTNNMSLLYKYFNRWTSVIKMKVTDKS